MPWTQFKINWTPTTDSVRQIAYWRIKGDTIWNTIGFTPANPLTGSATNTTLYLEEDFDTTKQNVIYQFKVANVCSTIAEPVDNDNGIIEAISFLDVNDTIHGIASVASTQTGTTSGKFTIVFNGTPHLSRIRIRVKRLSDDQIYRDLFFVIGVTATDTIWDETTLTQQFMFTGLTTGTEYFIELELFAIINGAEVRSNDASQLRGAHFFNENNSTTGDWHSNLSFITL